MQLLLNKDFSLIKVKERKGFRYSSLNAPERYNTEYIFFNFSRLSNTCSFVQWNFADSCCTVFKFESSVQLYTLAKFAIFYSLFKSRPGDKQRPPKPLSNIFWQRLTELWMDHVTWDLGHKTLKNITWLAPCVWRGAAVVRVIARSVSCGVIFVFISTNRKRERRTELFNTKIGE